MSCNENWERIGDYVDDALDSNRAATLEAHLVTCARCRAVVADLRALRAATLALGPELPPAHLWAKVSRALEAEPRPPAWRAWLNEGFFAWQPIASVAVLVLLVSGLIFVGGRLTMPGRPDTQAALVPAETTGPAGSVDAEFRLAEEQYIATIASLEEIARSEAAGLDEQTSEMLRESTQVIDEAIGESRAALENEPANELAQESLFGALQSKIALLEDTVALINDMRQDGREPDAANSPGLNQ